MRFLKYSLLVSAICISFGPSAARAEEVFQWNETHTQFSATFPDDWRQTSGQQPDDVLTIMAPGEYDYAECRLRRHEDRRFVIYPRDFAGPVQRTGYSNQFIDAYLGQFADASLNEGRDNAGLGQGFAAYADFSFITSAGPKVQKRGIMLGGVYNDKSYVFECSAEASAFDKWHHAFLGILKSVDFRTEYSTQINGKYRPFQKKDGLLIIKGATPLDEYIY